MISASSAIVVYSSARRVDDFLFCLRDEAEEVGLDFVFSEMLILGRCAVEVVVVLIDEFVGDVAAVASVPFTAAGV